MQIYLVGGAVRSPSTARDYDYVIEHITPEIREHLKKFLIGKDFHVYLVDEDTFFGILKLCKINNLSDVNFAPGSVRWPVELAETRVERSIGPAHTDFEVNSSNVSIIEDLRRRDLTMNAQALLPNGIIIDPFNGKVDYRLNILREVDQDTFIEDPLRVLRAARFFANNPKTIIAHSLHAAMQTAAVNLHTVSPERVWIELSKVSNWPRFFEVLYATKCLPHAFPELQALAECNEPSEWHQEPSIFIHTMMVIRALPDNASKALKIAALYHDILKPEYYALYGKAYGHENVKSLPSFIPSGIAKDALLLINNHQTIYDAHTLKPGKLATFMHQYLRPQNQHLLADQITLANADREGRITENPVTPLWQLHMLPLLLANLQRIPITQWIASQKTPPSPKRIGQARVELAIKICSNFKKYIKELT